MNPISLDHLIKQALEEDLGMGDWSSQWLFDALNRKNGRFVARQSGIFAGMQVVERVYYALGGGVELSWLVERWSGL